MLWTECRLTAYQIEQLMHKKRLNGPSEATIVRKIEEYGIQALPPTPDEDDGVDYVELICDNY